MRSATWLLVFSVLGISISKEDDYYATKYEQYYADFESDDSKPSDEETCKAKGTCREEEDGTSEPEAEPAHKSQQFVRYPWRTLKEWPYHGTRHTLLQNIDPASEVLGKIGTRLRNEVAKDKDLAPTCSKQITSFADHFHQLNRVLPRHPYADIHCTLEQMDWDKDGSLWKWQPPIKPLVDPVSGQRKTSATLVFSILLGPWDDLRQVTRLLSHIFQPGHAFVVRIDSNPKTTNADALAGMVEKIAKAKEVWDRTLVIRHTDIVYPGMSIVDGDIEIWYNLLHDNVAEEGFQWDFIINLSGSDYPLMSVECMAKHLAGIGVHSHIEAFIQTPTFSRGRNLRDVFVECLDDPCRQTSSSSDQYYGGNTKHKVPNCTGYIHRLPNAKKPPMVGSFEFGGSHWGVLHHDFVNYTLACLDADDPSGIYKSDPYCASVRGMYDYFATNLDPDELFIHTALLNGPSCNAFRPGNLRWTNWKQSESKLRTSTPIAVNSPGIIKKELASFIARSAGNQGPRKPILARKLSMKEHPGSYTEFDNLIKLNTC